MKIPITIIAVGAVTILFSEPVAKGLQGHVQSAETNTNFTYTVFNDEPTNSTLSINVFHLAANAPFTVGSIPPGWSYATDGFTYIDWFTSDTNFSIAPGAHSVAFTIESQVLTLASNDCALVSWEAVTAETGIYSTNTVISPSLVDLSVSLANPSSTNNTFQFKVIAPPSYSWFLSTSSDPSSWQVLGTNLGSCTFVQTNFSLFTSRFYRGDVVLGSSPLSAD